MHEIGLGNKTILLKPVDIIGFTLRTLMLRPLKFCDFCWFYHIAVCATALLAFHLELQGYSILRVYFLCLIFHGLKQQHI